MSELSPTTGEPGNYGFLVARRIGATATVTAIAFVANITDRFPFNTTPAFGQEEPIPTETATPTPTPEPSPYAEVTATPTSEPTYVPTEADREAYNIYIEECRSSAKNVLYGDPTIKFIGSRKKKRVKVRLFNSVQELRFCDLDDPNAESIAGVGSSDVGDINFYGWTEERKNGDWKRNSKVKHINEDVVSSIGYIDTVIRAKKRNKTGKMRGVVRSLWLPHPEVNSAQSESTKRSTKVKYNSIKRTR